MLKRLDPDSKKIVVTVLSVIVALFLYKLFTKTETTFITAFDFVLTLIAFLFILTVHEVSHGFVAYLFGDPTPKLQGRLTLNPLKHLDLLGLVMLFIVKIGWAKPIVINPKMIKKKRFAYPIIAVAGPVSNLIFAFILFIFLKQFIGTDFFQFFIFSGGTASLLLQKGWNAIPATVAAVSFKAFYINILLASFNLIPIPPLDGSKILKSILPTGGKRFLDSMEPYGFVIILILYYTGVLKPVIFKMFNFFMKYIYFNFI